MGEISLRDYLPLSIPISCQSQEPRHSTTHLQGMRLTILQNSGPAQDNNGQQLSMMFDYEYQQTERIANMLHHPKRPPHNRLTINNFGPDADELLQGRPYTYRPTFKTNVLELFSIQSEVPEEERRAMNVEHIYFPPMLKMFDIKNYARQWWSEHRFDEVGNCIEDGGGSVNCIEDGDDYYGGVKLCGPPNAYLAANGGLTAYDRTWINNRLNQVVEGEAENLANIWE